MNIIVNVVRGKLTINKALANIYIIMVIIGSKWMLWVRIVLYFL